MEKFTRIYATIFWIGIGILNSLGTARSYDVRDLIEQNRARERQIIHLTQQNLQDEHNICCQWDTLNLGLLLYIPKVAPLTHTASGEEHTFSVNDFNTYAISLYETYTQNLASLANRGGRLYNDLYKYANANLQLLLRLSGENKFEAIRGLTVHRIFFGDPIIPRGTRLKYFFNVWVEPSQE